MSEFTKIETQEQLDKIISERLKRVEDKHKSELEELKKSHELEIGEIKKNHSTELESLNKDISDLKANADKYKDYDKSIIERDNKIKAYEITNEKIRIALENGLDFGAVDFLKGETTEEIKESAKAFKNLCGSVASPSAKGEHDGVKSSSENSLFRGMAKDLFKE